MFRGELLVSGSVVQNQSPFVFYGVKMGIELPGCIILKFWVLSNLFLSQKHLQGGPRADRYTSGVIYNPYK